jgi:GDPmannose 4,6-dehydratase
MIPTNPYGISKLSAHLMVQYYRDVKQLFACNGILFNHESKLRGDSFVSKKVCREVARIVKYGGSALYLGNIEAKKDWGYAPDYVTAFHLMLQQKNAEDFIISAGKLHTVKDMVNAAFNALDYAISWQGNGLNCTATNSTGNEVVAIDKKYFRPLDNRYLMGNNSKARLTLNLNHLTPFNQWIKTMTIAEYEKLT